MRSREYAEGLKLKIDEIFGINLRFNREFSKHGYKIKSQEENLLDWLKCIAKGNIFPTTESKIGDDLVFIKKIGSSNRCIVLKQKNGIFTECHLGDHKYYDYLRKKLGL